MRRWPSSNARLIFPSHVVPHACAFLSFSLFTSFLSAYPFLHTPPYTYSAIFLSYFLIPIFSLRSYPAYAPASPISFPSSGLHFYFFPSFPSLLFSLSLFPSILSLLPLPSLILSFSVTFLPARLSHTFFLLCEA